MIDSHTRKTSLLAIPVIAIVILVSGMTQQASAASTAQSSSRTGVNILLSQLLEGTAQRTAARVSSQSSSRSSSLKSAAPAASTSLNSYQAEVFKLVNAERKKQGLPAYTYNETLDSSAQDYAEHMQSENCFSHTACGSTLKQRMHASGYYQNDGHSYYYGENIARGQDTAADVMEDWMNSSSHRAAILSTKFKEIGVGKSSTYWVQHFGVIK